MSPTERLLTKRALFESVKAATGTTIAAALSGCEFPKTTTPPTPRQRPPQIKTTAEGIQETKDKPNYHYGPKSSRKIQMEARLALPSSWYSHEITPDEYSQLSFRLTEEWLSPKGNFTKYMESGKAWIEVGIYKQALNGLSLDDHLTWRLQTWYGYCYHSREYKMIGWDCGESPIQLKEGEIVDSILGGIRGKIQEFVITDPKYKPFWIKSFAAFLEGTDEMLFVDFGSGSDKRSKTEKEINGILRTLKLSLRLRRRGRLGERLIGIVPTRTKETKD